MFVPWLHAALLRASRSVSSAVLKTTPPEGARWRRVTLSRLGWEPCPCTRENRGVRYARLACACCAGMGVLRGPLERVRVELGEAGGTVLLGSVVVQVDPGWRGDRETPPEPPQGTVLGVEVGACWIEGELALALLPRGTDETATLADWERTALEQWEDVRAEAWERASGCGA